MTFEIYWDDLTPKAKTRLQDLYHENINLAPIAIIELDESIDLDDDVDYD